MSEKINTTGYIPLVEAGASPSSEVMLHNTRVDVPEGVVIPREESLRSHGFNGDIRAIITLPGDENPDHPPKQIALIDYGEFNPADPPYTFVMNGKPLPIFGKAQTRYGLQAFNYTPAGHMNSYVPLPKSEGKLELGRNDGWANDLLGLNVSNAGNKSISRTHLTIELADSRIGIVDHSSNGTYVRLPESGDNDRAVTQERSVQMLNNLVNAATELEAEVPGFVGMTAFGSTVRGEATADSDADVFVFVDPSKPLQAEDGKVYDVAVKKGTVESLPQTYFLDFVAGKEYEHRVGEQLGRNHVYKADIIPLPIDTEIVGASAQDLLTIASQIDRGKRVGAHVARNIRALFHVPIANGKLQPYVEQTLKALSSSPSGETAWQIIRSHVIGSERPKTQKHTQSVQHRYIPATLEEARGYYLHEK